jgi:hypothetical protein
VEVPPLPEVDRVRKKNPPEVEEKSSDPEPPEVGSSGGSKRKVRYEGQGGRIHTEAQIDEILDFYLMTNELPVYVTDRQRYDYRHHKRLPERKELLEQRGVSVIIDLSSTSGRAQNIIPINGTNVQRKSGTSR